MRGLRRFFPSTTVSGALWFALRHRQPLLDWAGWTARSVPRLIDGEHRDLLAEARLPLACAPMSARLRPTWT